MHNHFKILKFLQLYGRMFLMQERQTGLRKAQVLIIK